MQYVLISSKQQTMSFVSKHFKVDKEGTCRRQICECDKALATRLVPASESEDGWNAAHHAFYGGFDSRSKCLRSVSPGPGNDVKVQCCGTGMDR